MKPKPPLVLFLICFCIAVGYIGSTIARKQQVRTAVAPPDSTTSAPAASRTPPTDPAAHDSRPPQGIVPKRRSGTMDLFGEPVEPVAPTYSSPTRTTPTNRPELDPLSAITYNGMVSVDGKTSGFIRNMKYDQSDTVSVGDSLEGYRIKAIARDSITLVRNGKERSLALSKEFDPVPMHESQTAVLPDPGNLTAFRTRIDHTFYFQVTGAQTGQVWGYQGVFSDDSALAAASVEAGALQVGERGVVIVTILKGYHAVGDAAYSGMPDKPHRTWPGYYKIVGPKTANPRIRM